MCEEHSNCCAICLEPLNDGESSTLWQCQHKRSCRHMFHLNCAQQVLRSRAAQCNCVNHKAKCPYCRAPYSQAKPLPNVHANPEEWLRHIAAVNATGPCGTETQRWVSEEDILAALSARFTLNEAFIDELKRRVASLPTTPGQEQNTVSFSGFMDATEGVLPLIRALLPAEPAQGEHEARGGAEEAEGPAVACVLSPQAEASALQADSATTRALYNQRVWHRALHNIYNPGRPAPRLTGAPPALTEEEREEYYRHLDQQYQRALDARKNERLSLLQAAASQQQKKSLWKRVKAALPGRR
mmetsp:Transcript_131783/g.196367  ORF Transcript_131783/g.196367 Transcript_131783/m.196367 type:complete len:299 (-) Transcript_131783:97-993(-)